MNTLELVYKWKESSEDVSPARLSIKERHEELVALTHAIGKVLKSGEDVTIYGIGKMKLKKIPERTGRHPKTGEAIVIPAKKTVVLTMNKAFRGFLNK